MARDWIDEAAVVREYLEGSSGREVAARHGAELTTVRRILEDWGVPRRRTGPRGRTDVPTELIVSLRDDDHLDFQTIATEVGLARTTVRKRYIRATMPRKRWPDWVRRAPR